MKKLLLATLIFFSGILLAQAEDFSEGIEYQKLSEPQPTDTGDKVEVLEFFWYGCPHCYHFEPFVRKWLANKPASAEFVRVPAVFRPDWKVHARTYYALIEMGLVEKLHGKIFDAIHKDHQHLSTLDEMADFLASEGVDRQTFVNTYNSFLVDARVRKAVKKLAAYDIDGVPTVIVNGKYRVTGRMAGNYETMIDVINYLVGKESQGRK